MRQNNYETVIVLAADVQGPALKEFEDRLEKLFKTHHISDLEKRDWGVLKLAYTIKKRKSGHYYQFNYKAASNFVTELERNLGYEESVLRHLTFRNQNAVNKNNPIEAAAFDWQ